MAELCQCLVEFLVGSVRHVSPFIVLESWVNGEHCRVQGLGAWKVCIVWDVLGQVFVVPKFV